ncbi:MAG: 50S ribosomal protein L11 methyltransferase [candidate division NC10 bacterium]|nr:50S ribosomal protein L11 methyltransferase [candidate division NC10 bacterium]
MTGGYIEVNAVATGETEEALCGFFFDEEALGLVTEDLPGDPPGVLVRASFGGTVPVDPLIERLRRYQDSLAALGFSGAVGRIEVRPIPLEDWGRNWKKHFKPLPVGTRLVIAPPWEHGPFPEGRLVIRIDPAMAFGTGHHATTRMCLEALEEFMDRWPGSEGPTVLDVGTGTGILAIAAAALGARRVVAIDTDPEACDAAGKNLTRHDCVNRVHILSGGLEALAPDLRFNVVLANLDTKTLCPLFPALATVLAPRGRLITGGIPVEDGEKVTAALGNSALRILARRAEEGWLCLTLAA